MFNFFGSSNSPSCELLTERVLEEALDQTKELYSLLRAIAFMTVTNRSELNVLHRYVNVNTKKSLAVVVRFVLFSNN